jgi:hypothetical protein
MKKHIMLLLMLGSGLPISLQAADNNNDATAQVTCTENSSEDTGEYGQQCLYKKLSLLKAYQQFRKDHINSDDGKYLTDDLNHLKAQSYQENKADVTIQYTWKSKNELEVEMNFQGGTTTVTFTENKQGTNVAVADMPD